MTTLENPAALRAAVRTARTERKGSVLAGWLSSTDHKIIGHMYLITSFVFFLGAGIMALLIRIQLLSPTSNFLSDQIYNELFTMHGTIMLLLFATPLFVGFANELVPLQIGSPDVAFPRLNLLSYYLFTFGGLILFGSFLAPGGSAAFGWYAYAPLTSATNSPGIGADLWIMGLALSGFGTILGGVNFVTTIFCMRAPGMTMFRMPIFTWNALLTSMLVLLAFPVLAAALLVLEIDRRLGAQVFSANSGGAILWQNLFWFFGHPEVYILALPFFGIATEILPVFSRKPLFGYKTLIAATIAIAGLSMTVWAHHMFTTGAVLLPFFSFMTLLIAIPTGVKFFNWAGTMWKGQLSLRAADAVHDRLPHRVPLRRHHRHHPGVPADGLRGLRLLLRGGALPLRARGHRAVRDVRRPVLLVAEDDRQDAQQPDRQGPVLADVHRLQHDVPRPALGGRPGPGAAHRELPVPAGRRHHAERHLDRRLLAARACRC